MNRIASLNIMAAAALLAGPTEIIVRPDDVVMSEPRKMTPQRHVKHGQTYAPNGAREVARRLKRANKSDS